MTTPVTNVGLQDFQRQVLDASRTAPVLVDFWADWCGPCKMLGPVLDRIAQSLPGRLVVAKVDTEAEPELAARFQIRSIPAVMLFKDGKVVAQFVGAQPEGAIRKWLEPHLPPAADGALAAAREAWRQGDADRARAQLTMELATTPDDHACRLLLAEIELASGRPAEARTLLDALPPDRQFGPEVERLRARLFFADELAALGAAASDLDALYASALRSAAAGQADAAADALLALAERSRAYRDDAGRKALLKLFELNPDDDGIPDYRRRLGRLLH